MAKKPRASERIFAYNKALMPIFMELRAQLLRVINADEPIATLQPLLDRLNELRTQIEHEQNLTFVLEPTGWVLIAVPPPGEADDDAPEVTSPTKKSSKMRKETVH